MRFTIRELVLVTVIAALALGWWISDQRHRANADSADRWRECAQLLGGLLKDEGWKITWNLKVVSLDAEWDQKNATEHPIYIHASTMRWPGE